MLYWQAYLRYCRMAQSLQLWRPEEVAVVEVVAVAEVEAVVEVVVDAGAVVVAKNWLAYITTWYGRWKSINSLHAIFITITSKQKQ